MSDTINAPRCCKKKNLLYCIQTAVAELFLDSLINCVNLEAGISIAVLSGNTGSRTVRITNIKGTLVKAKVVEVKSRIKRLLS